MRINVLLGLDEDLAGAGYNVHQSEITPWVPVACGKGLLNGTQTKLKFVPEQDTDFISVRWEKDSWVRQVCCCSS